MQDGLLNPEQASEEEFFEIVVLGAGTIIIVGNSFIFSQFVCQASLA